MTAGPPQTITACLIVLDEAPNIRRALASVAFCDEVVVVDSGSRDGTPEIARELGAVVVHNPWPGFGAQRNVALDHAHGDWVLELDADETITPELAAEILAFLADPGRRDRVDLLVLPMRHQFLGALLGASAQYPNYRARVFRRGTQRHDEGRTVHEGLWPRDATLPLQHDIIHVLADSWGEAFGDVWRYSRLEASQFHPRLTARSVVIGAAVRPAAKAVFRLAVAGAWRDGWRGWLKVALDSGSDALVWGRVVARGPSTGTGPAPAAHFGEPVPMAGRLRLVALATGDPGARRAAAWLEAAVAAGAGIDSELVTPATSAAPGAGFVLRPTTSSGPLAMARGLLASTQVRGIDALVLADAGAQRLHRTLASQLRGAASPVGVDEAPAAVVARLSRELRPALRPEAHAAA